MDHATDSGLVVAIADSSMGGGERRLGLALMANFLRLLRERDLSAIKAVVCYNEGVKLAIADSPALNHLKALEAKDVPVLICRTCVEYFDIEDKLAVGRLSTMHEIQRLMLGHRVVQP